MRKKFKFIQMEAVSYGEREISIYALDDAGMIWVHQPAFGKGCFIELGQHPYGERVPWLDERGTRKDKS